ncbi:glycosyltransferase family 2 protein [Flavobacterium sp. SM15]|uniref:glycosyltransferase family 2 protein n=1 Tax=Flavobacterium sp. SM15 TaxID=2908005 RepID=UPI001EDBFD9F|nr:glycosyltransferase family 2 protein [Flavobacterium sp. SM15]MCG2611041.1 glycosyltransferase family 2 protein [Flavobacterium sp. SM15]
MSTEKKYDVAVILINYNSSDFTINCIEKIIEKTSTALSYQIVVVDNASEKEDCNKVEQFCNKANLEHLTFVRSKINTGFGGGNMYGVQFANANYYAFVNNDSIFINDCLSIIVNAMKNNSEYGICGPLCFKEDGKLLPTIDHFASPGREILGRKFLEKFNPKIYPNRKTKYTEPKQAQFVSGSFMVVNAADFNAVGGFDTNIFLYYEETDLCKRLLKMGKKAFLIPKAEFIHYHGVSTPSSINIKIELKISLLYVIRKHYGFIWHRILLTYLQVQYFFKSFFKPKYWPLFKVLFKGASLSDSLKTKQRIQS